jgi:hypothetical protein
MWLKLTAKMIGKTVASAAIAATGLDVASAIEFSSAQAVVVSDGRCCFPLELFE